VTVFVSSINRLLLAVEASVSCGVGTGLLYITWVGVFPRWWFEVKIKFPNKIKIHYSVNYDVLIVIVIYCYFDILLL
jgi:hypothetical protein